MAEYRVGVTFVGDDKNLNRAIGRVESRLQKFGRNTDAAITGKGASGLFSGKSVGAFAGGAAAYKVLTDSIDAASNLNEQMTKNTVVFGESSSALMEWSKTTANAFGVARDQALEFTGVFGNMLRPMGIGTQQASVMSRKLVELAADMASFNNASIEDTLLAIRSGLAGESEPLRKFGVLLSEARVQQEAMSATGKKSAKELTAQEKAMARYRLILKDTALAQGDFARTSDGYANSQRKLQANLRDLESTLGGLVVPALATATEAANKLLEALNSLAGMQIKFDILATFHLGKGGTIDLGGVGDKAKTAADLATWLGPTGLFKAFWQSVLDDGFNPDFGAPGGTGLTGAPGAPRGGAGAQANADKTKKSKSGDGLTRLQRLQLEAIRATRNNYLSDDIRIAKAIVEIYRGQMKGKRGKALNEAAKNFEDAQNDLYRLQQELADRASSDADKNKARIKKAAEKAAEAQRKLGKKLAESADKFKNALLDALDRKQDNLDTNRAIVDAKEALRIAQQGGGQHGIMMAKRELKDAYLARERFLAENAKVTANKGGGYTVVINGMTVNGVQNVKELLAEIQKVSRSTSTQARGRRMGHHVWSS